MSDELEAVGALATSGLAAAALEAGAPKHGVPAAHGAANCANCGTALTGAFCSACGQSAHVHRSLLHLGEELLHGILHFDAKGWRTLPLLVVRPGLLTRRYIDGQRARHVSPLALFLFSVFLMFFVFSFIAAPTVTTTLGDSDDADSARAEVAVGAAEAASAVRVAEVVLAAAKARGDTNAVTEAQAGLTAALAGQGVLALAARALGPAASVAQGAASAVQAEAVPGKEQKILDISFGNDSLDRALERALKNPDLLYYKLKNTAYKFSFLLVPISLPFLWLMFFWRRGVSMYDHAVFALYSLAFMSVLFILLALLEPLHARGAQAVLLFAVAPVHMFMHLLETYRLGFLAALWRTLALLMVCAVVLLLFLLFIIALTAR
jgi:hypothetical protein